MWAASVVTFNVLRMLSITKADGVPSVGGLCPWPNPARAISFMITSFGTRYISGSDKVFKRSNIPAFWNARSNDSCVSNVMMPLYKRNTGDQDAVKMSIVRIALITKMIRLSCTLVKCHLWSLLFLPSLCIMIPYDVALYSRGNVMARKCLTVFNFFDNGSRPLLIWHILLTILTKLPPSVILEWYIARADSINIGVIQQSMVIVAMVITWDFCLYLIGSNTALSLSVVIGAIDNRSAITKIFMSKTYIWQLRWDSTVKPGCNWKNRLNEAYKKSAIAILRYARENDVLYLRLMKM